MLPSFAIPLIPGMVEPCWNFQSLEIVCISWRSEMIVGFHDVMMFHVIYFAGVVNSRLVNCHVNCGAARSYVNCSVRRWGVKIAELFRWVKYHNLPISIHYTLEFV